MKFDFTYYNPTKIYFGKDSLSNLSAELSGYGKNILLMYGKGSVKKSGLYDKVIKILSDAGKSVTELPGIKSNPTYEQLKHGATLVRENDIDLILAVGGGSVIDCAKGISVSAYAKGDPWEKYWINFEEVDNRVVPVASILTMAGTGSEMNGGSVITNEAAMLKNGRVFGPEVYPKFSILNPEYTFTVPAYQMASGIYDTFSHLCEQYFSGDDDNVTDYIIEGLMRSLISSAYKALDNREDYEARSNIMWCATVALNTLCGLSKETDWEEHMIEHQIGAYTDCAHGAGLAAISKAYYEYIYKFGKAKFRRFAENVWGIGTDKMTDDEAAKTGIGALSGFINDLGLPGNITELGVTDDMIEKIAKSTVPGGGYKKMTADDIEKVLKASM